jgi:hypothetical protein
LSRRMTAEVQGLLRDKRPIEPTLA